MKVGIRAKRDAIAQEVIARQAAMLAELAGVALPAAMTERQRGTLEVRMMKFREGAAEFLTALVEAVLPPPISGAELAPEAEPEMAPEPKRKRKGA